LVELYFTPEADPTGYGEGTQLVATYSQSSQDYGYQFQMTLPGDIRQRVGYLTATCTAFRMYTSEFSRVLPLNMPDQVPPIAAVMRYGTLLRTTEPRLSFRIVLSEPAIGFGPEDLVIGGSAGASILSVTESMAVYSVVVGDFQQPGTITLSIPPGSFTDAAGNPNPAAGLADSDIPQFIHNLPPAAQVLEPSGPVRGIAEIPFVLRDAESDPCHISALYSFDGGTKWSGVWPFEGQQSEFNLLSSPEGTPHIYRWNVASVNDGKDGQVLFRLMVNDGVRYDYFRSEPITLIVDNHPPTGSISPAPGEVRSSTASSFLFNVNFSEAVTGLDAGDIVIEGTAGASAAVVSGSGKAYSVSVSGMVRAGTVSIRIPAGAVVDQAGTAMSTTATSGSYTVPAQWLPYQPAPAQAELTIDTTTTTRYTVTLSFPDAGYRVTNWDPPVRIGDVFGVNVNVERWTGDSAQVLTTFSHVYDLGTLTPGRYTLDLSAWGVPVESQPFVVPRPTYPNPPGTPWALPGRIEAENFDTGAEGVAYHDAELANLGGKYRTDVGVDIESATGGGYNIGYVKAGEWLEYTVNIASAGTYNLTTRMANTAAGGKFHLELDGVPITSALAVPNTGGWQNWQTPVTNGLVIPSAGEHMLRLCFDTNATNGFVGNFDWLQLTAVAPPNAPTGVAASDNTFANKVRVTWTGSVGATAYEVYRSTTNNSATATKINASDITGTSYDDPTAVTGTPYYYWVKARNAGGVSNFSASDVGTRASGPTQSPYWGTPFSVGALIQAEDFDNGGSGVAYSDSEAQNLGGAYRPAEGVDIEGSNGKYNVGWVKAGEWLEYTVNVPTAGTYKLESTWASPASGGVFHIEFDGVNKTGALAVPKTGGWQTWQTISTTVNLAAGTQVMRVAFDTNGSIGYVGNLEWLKLSSTVTPIKIQAEDFVGGGEGVGYHDVDTANLGGKYRTGEGVDIETTTDTGGGYNVGYTKAGEWLKYTATVATAGTYSIDFRVASAGAGGTFHLEVDGVNVTGALAVPNTGGWQSWQTITRSGISLSAGTHTFRLVFDANGSSGFVGNFNWLQIRG
jgi:hypothetical protein